MQINNLKLSDVALSFSQKVTLYAVGVTFITLLIAGFSFTLYDTRESKKGLESTLELQADLIANHAIEALIRKDKDKAFEIIDAIGNVNFIKGAWLYDKDRHLFSSYDPNDMGDEALKNSVQNGSRYENNALWVSRPIMVGKENLGTIILKSSLDSVHTRFIFHITIVIGVMLLSLICAVFIAYKLQKSLTNPLRELINTVKLVIHTNDYTYRAQRLSKDDLGVLTDAFNRMLHHIETSNKALKSNEERLHLALWGADEILLDWDLKSDQLYFDDVVLGVLDIKKEAVPKTLEAYIRLVHPDDLGKLQNALFQHLKGETSHFENEHRLGITGTYRWLLMRGKVVERNKRGEPLRLTGICHDITVQHEAQEEIKLFHEVFSSTTEGVVITDNEFQIVQCNKAFTKITGYQLEELKKHTLEVIFANRYRPLYQSIKYQLASEGKWQGELHSIRLSGEDFPAHLSLNTMQDTEGQVTRYVGVFSDLTSSKQQEDKLQYLTHFDPLTNLPNRILLKKNLEKAVKSSLSTHEMFGLIIVGIDNFKLINDTFGNMVGDNILKKAALRLLRTVPSRNHLARLGGDEFALIVEKIQDKEELSEKAEEILNLISSKYRIEEHEIVLGACIGISLFPKDCQDLETLIMNADTAMLHAKKEERNTYQFFIQSMNEQVTERQQLETLLRSAIEKNEFKLSFQPKIEARTGRVAGCEALLRWHQSELGNICPSRFIPIAEETGLIVTIGEWVLRQACMQGQYWRQEGWHDFTIAINVSGVQFKKGDFSDKVKKILHETGFPRHCLDLEITEGALVSNMEQCCDLLSELRTMGVTVSVDDFGTGYSSLSYLRKFPIDALKIDQSFVRDMMTNPEDANIIAAVIAMAKSLELKTIAEGVETIDQVNALKDLGCDLLQGYYYSKPIFAEDFYQFYLAQNERKSISS